MRRREGVLSVERENAGVVKRNYFALLWKV
jgi:hypothetical protein